MSNAANYYHDCEESNGAPIQLIDMKFLPNIKHLSDIKEMGLENVFKIPQPDNFLTLKQGEEYK